MWWVWSARLGFELASWWRAGVTGKKDTGRSGVNRSVGGMTDIVPGKGMRGRVPGGYVPLRSYEPDGEIHTYALRGRQD